MKVLVFNTSLKTKDDINRIKPIIESFTKILEWSVDLEDWESVLRIVTSDPEIENIISARLRGIGFDCTDLEH
jgi:hypothetical protein